MIVLIMEMHVIFKSILTAGRVGTVIFCYYVPEYDTIRINHIHFQALYSTKSVDGVPSKKHLSKSSSTSQVQKNFSTAVIQDVDPQSSCGHCLAHLVQGALLPHPRGQQRRVQQVVEGGFRGDSYCSTKSRKT